MLETHSLSNYGVFEDDEFNSDIFNTSLGHLQGQKVIFHNYSENVFLAPQEVIIVQDSS